MGRDYIFVNFDKKQKISFDNINTGTKLRELSGTSISASIITYYLLTNNGDKIAFIDDHETNFTFFGQIYNLDDLDNFEDVTKKIIDEPVKQKIIKDNGIIWVDKEENLFFHDLVNIWDTTPR